MTKVGDALWSVVAKLQPRESGRRVPPADAHAMVKAGEAVLLDIREAGELGAGLAEGARWIATSEIQNNSESWRALVAELPKDKRIITYCAAGVRAEKVATLLAELGFQSGNAGGFKDWVAAGLPVVPRG